MGASEGPGSTVETLFDEERPGTLVVLIPYRVQVTSAGSENTGTFDDFDAVHEHRGTRALVRNPVERVVAGAGDVTRPRLFAAAAVLDRQVAPSARAGCMSSNPGQTLSSRSHAGSQ